MTVGGVTYPARPISVAAILDFQAAVQAAGQDEAKAQAAVRGLVRQMYPWKLAYAIGWFDPARWLTRQEPGVIQAALTDFFGHLAGGMTATQPTTTPPSPPSAPPTPPRFVLGDADLTVV